MASDGRVTANDISLAVPQITLLLVLADRPGTGRTPLAKCCSRRNWALPISADAKVIQLMRSRLREDPG